MYVIATAGHVDHGKSTLVRTLTGINPDRLREEQQREMTIDLGFAWMTLPDHTPIGIIDVPGHIDFIDNMLAGVGGIDMALIVIAADEGPMPQTLEHLAILQLLHVQQAVIALTKVDLVDAEWLALIGDDIRKLLAPTALKDAAIVPVSARTHLGLAQLIEQIGHTLHQAPPRKDIGKARLPIDRVFSVPGFGTVVTGTLVDGGWVLGDEAEIHTLKGETLLVRIRGLQTHKQKLERAQPGSRVAVNISGVNVDQIARGAVLAQPGVIHPSTLIDVRLDMLDVDALSRAKSSPFKLKHNTEIKLFSGAAQSMAQVRLLEGPEAQPGQSCWAQLQLTTPMALTPGERFIVRIPSPSITVGGGIVVDAHPTQRYRRRAGHVDEDTLIRLDALSKGTPEERLISALTTAGISLREAVTAKAQLSAAAFDAAAQTLIQSGVLQAAQNVFGLTTDWRGLQQQAAERLGAFHRAQPLQDGMPRDTLRSQLKLDARVFNALLALAQTSSSANALADNGDTVRLAAHQVQLTPAQQRAVDGLLAQCAAQPWNTPSVKECKAAVSDGVFDVLVRRQTLILCGPDVVLLPETYSAAVQQIRVAIQQHGQITAAQVRDLFGTTRKYALALLEHLDAIGITKRMGDARVLKA